jgi:hypothetical protein
MPTLPLSCNSDWQEIGSRPAPVLEISKNARGIPPKRRLSSELDVRLGVVDPADRS